MIGSRIREAREAQGLSLEQLAEQVGVSFQSVQQWEVGKTSPRPNRLRKLAVALKTTPAWIQFGDTEVSAERFEQIFDLVNSQEFRDQISSSFGKSIQTLISLGWIKVTKPELTLGLLSDVFCSQINEDFGLASKDSDSSHEFKPVSQAR